MVSYQRHNRRELTSTGSIIYIFHSFLGQGTLVHLYRIASEWTLLIFLGVHFLSLMLWLDDLKECHHAILSL